MGTLMKIVTERAMGMYLEKLDKVKETKVREFFEKAEVRVAGADGAARKPGAAPVRAVSICSSVFFIYFLRCSFLILSGQSASSGIDKENQPPRGAIELPKTSSRASVIPSKPSSAAAKKKPASATSTLSAASAAAAAAASAPKKKVAPKDDEPVILKYTPDSAEAWMTEAFEGVNLKELGDSNWKVRLGGMYNCQDGFVSYCLVSSLTMPSFLFFIYFF
jgi:cytoskeleton-associated protein 5